jgi:APA family basic amino acid/polyamine antiporter
MIPIDFFFIGLSALCLFVFRRRDLANPERVLTAPGFRVPGHPYTTILFIVACWTVVGNTIYTFPENSLIGVGILLLGLPVYFLWDRKRRKVA